MAVLKAAIHNCRNPADFSIADGRGKVNRETKRQPTPCEVGVGLGIPSPGGCEWLDNHSDFSIADLRLEVKGMSWILDERRRAVKDRWQVKLDEVLMDLGTAVVKVEQIVELNDDVFYHCTPKGVKEAAHYAGKAARTLSELAGMMDEWMERVD